MMNAWLWAAVVILICFIPCSYVCFRGKTVVDRLVALELASVLETLVLVLIAQGYQRSVFIDIALAMAVLSFGGGLVFTRFIERWA
jgi:multicomponent Na+:H+ antiporter subunit F